MTTPRSPRTSRNAPGAGRADEPRPPRPRDPRPAAGPTPRDPATDAALKGAVEISSEDSFPASDPPGWIRVSSGGSLPDPEGSARARA